MLKLAERRLRIRALLLKLNIHQSPGDLIKMQILVLQTWGWLRCFVAKHLPGVAALSSKDEMIPWVFSSSNTPELANSAKPWHKDHQTD